MMNYETNYDVTATEPAPLYDTFDRENIVKKMTDHIYNKQYVETEEKLKADPMWIQASKDVYKQFTGMEWSGSDEDAAKEGLERMSTFNWNVTTGTAGQSFSMMDAPDATKLSFLYLMESYEEADISGRAVLSAFKNLGFDPLSYMSLASLGFAFSGREALKEAAKTGVKKMLTEAAERYVKSSMAVGATEGALYSGGDELARQNAAIGAGMQSEIDKTKLGVNTAVGGVVGGAGAKFFEKLASWYTNRTRTSAGEDFNEFFTALPRGDDPKYKPIRPYEYAKDFKDPVTTQVRDTMDSMKGEFDEHIAASIPTYREGQVEKASAIVKSFPEGATMIDIGGSEGGFSKAISKVSGGNIKTVNLDASEGMKESHLATPVEGSTFEYGSFQYPFKKVPKYNPKEKFDIVNESMMFQFIDEERATKLDEIKNKYLKDDGLLITDEKFNLADKSKQKHNERLKDTLHKNTYFTEEQLKHKGLQVLTTMGNRSAMLDDYVKELNKRFKFVQPYWESGNFKGFAASNDKAKVDTFMANFEPIKESEQFTSKGKYSSEDITNEVSPVEFSKAIKRSIKGMSDEKGLLSDVSVKRARDIVDSGGKLFLTKDKNAGGFILPDGYMGGLFKNPKATKSSAAKALQEARLKGGGKFFDSFDPNETLYIKNGFRPVARLKFDPDIAPIGWDKNSKLKGKPDNVFYVYDPSWKGDPKEGKLFEDYLEAYDYAKNWSKK
jgi:hypothetical protein